MESDLHDPGGPPIERAAVIGAGTMGSGIAVAFVATIYGVGLANLVFLPIGAKLRTIVNREIAKREMIADVFCGIATGENPRIIEERMTAY